MWYGALHCTGRPSCSVNDVMGPPSDGVVLCGVILCGRATWATAVGTVSWLWMVSGTQKGFEGRGKGLGRVSSVRCLSG